MSKKIKLYKKRKEPFMGTKFCQFCGETIDANEVVCPKCGKQLKPTKFCQFCGETIDADAVICPKCGKQVAEIKTAQTNQTPQIVIHNDNASHNVNTNNNNAGAPGYPHKSKMTALLLCLFLGWLGAHRFYVGKIGTGIIWLLTFGLFGVGTLIDFILIILGSFRDKYGMPLV